MSEPEPTRPTERLLEARRRIREAHTAGASGLETARALSAAVDDALRALWDGAGGHPGAALVAVGGYGRQEMSPGSDIDLIVLHAKRDDVSAPARALAYELWDAGMDVAPALHTPAEGLRLATSRVDSLTAFLDARLVAGDPGLFDEFRGRLQMWAERWRDKVRAQLAATTGERHARAGDAGAELEPNLKAGRGALRDLATLGWLDHLEAPPAPRPPALGAALDFLLRVRHELHYQSDRHTDTLAMRDQQAVAEALAITAGDTDGQGLAPEDVLMRRLYRHCRTVAHHLEAAFGRAVEMDLGTLPGGRAGMRWPDAVRTRFLALLTGANPRAAFEALDEKGVWVAAVPEWATIACLPQRNVYHRFAVDVHSLETVAAVQTLPGQAFPIIAESLPPPGPDRDLLTVACLFHDIGKGGSEDHSVRGERLARSAGERMGLAPGDVEDLAWLVRHHLLLAETATRRDIRDERVIVTVAESVGTGRRLRLLVALTAADSIATGPSAWGSWKATLISRLAGRVLHLLERGELVGGDVSALAARRERDLRGALVGFPAAEVDAHLANMPREWLLGEPPAELVRQSQAMLAPLRGDEVSLSAELEAGSGIWQALVVGRDRPGFFSRVSGTLALHGFNVVGAEVYTREDGLALEVFRLEALGDEEHRLDRAREDLRKVLAGRLSLDMRLAHKRRDYEPRQGKGKGGPPRMVIDNDSSDFYTLIDVHAEDRIGLLYAVTKVLADLMLDIHKAKVSTYGHDVVDVFYVRDAEGTKITDPGHAREVEASVLYAVSAAR
ncbi:MAG TPA: ACT domain-containing protein [Actinomycetota bacterium]|nr:ACT domain-containing protein [Actinomycetota bacterium]